MLPRDVVDYSIIPYLSFEDLMLHKHENHDFEKEYQRRINYLLDYGKGYEVLAAALETQDPRLKEHFFRTSESRENLPAEIEANLLESLRDSKLEIFNLISKYTISDIEKYIQISNLDAYYRYKLGDNIFSGMVDSVIDNLPSNHLDEFTSVLLSSKYQKNLPMDFLVKFYYLFPLSIQTDILEILKNQEHPRYQEFLDRMEEKLRDIGTDFLYDQEEAKEIHRLLSVVHDL